jgi:hypothetical protein
VRELEDGGHTSSLLTLDADLANAAAGVVRTAGRDVLRWWSALAV